ncbi:DUF7125 family protein [Halobiforma nitratireducens]|uniref:Chromosome partitioning ATPase n=1 Tax=Halobiforma nitratireducens JCM 10879 TaxID=1227454 RepID=M0LAI9_9EURY|nr:chromosome partitioning ATPase [Halobiforma nitratireducens]EMA30567.1 chromosome partitioning ATPase [Halobiforma nitratireducens JCM 10879]
MLVIAGGTDDCGTTTVTVGLADALARAGTPVIAASTDRRPPHLHAVAKVDRTPTLAALASDDSLETVLQRRTASTGGGDGETAENTEVGILPTPKSTAQADLKAAFERLESSDTRVLIDRPAGIESDAVDPLEYADGVVVVTTTSDRAVEASQATIEASHRLDVSVEGAVVTESNGVTDAFASKIGVPVLETVPEHESPLTAIATRAAFDELAAAIHETNGTPRQPIRHDSDETRLATGNPVVDRELGGVQPGTVVAIRGAPTSQAELLLYEATATRGTLYLTAGRSADDVRRALESTKVRTGNPTIRRLDRDAPLAHATELIEVLPDGATLVIDSVRPLERTGSESYVNFLSVLGERMRETGGVALLHCLSDSSSRSDRRETTLQSVDTVFDVRTIDAGVETGVEQRLAVSKCRRDPHSNPVLELEFGTDEADVRADETSLEHDICSWPDDGR